MPRFNPDDYEMVEVRIAKFYELHPQGSIITKLMHHSEDFQTIIFRATIYPDVGMDPVATGWAEEHQGGNGPNKDCWLENCETSAIGRALANMGLHGNKRPSREEMEKVAAHELPHKPNYKKEILENVEVIRRDTEGIPHKEWARKVVKAVLGHTNVKTEIEYNVVTEAIAKGLFDLATGEKTDE